MQGNHLFKLPNQPIKPGGRQSPAGNALLRKKLIKTLNLRNITVKELPPTSDRNRVSRRTSFETSKIDDELNNSRTEILSTRSRNNNHRQTFQHNERFASQLPNLSKDYSGKKKDLATLNTTLTNTQNIKPSKKFMAVTGTIWYQDHKINRGFNTSRLSMNNGLSCKDQSFWTKHKGLMETDRSFSLNRKKGKNKFNNELAQTGYQPDISDRNSVFRDSSGFRDTPAFNDTSPFKDNIPFKDASGFRDTTTIFKDTTSAFRIDQTPARIQNSCISSSLINNYMNQQLQKSCRSGVFQEDFSNAVEMLELGKDEHQIKLDNMLLSAVEDDTPDPNLKFEDVFQETKKFLPMVREHRLKAGLPRLVDMLETRFCFLYADCTNQKWPVKIVTDLPAVLFYYYVNYESIDDLRERKVSISSPEEVTSMIASLRSPFTDRASSPMRNRQNESLTNWNSLKSPVTERQQDETRLAKKNIKRKSKHIHKFRKPCYSYRDEKIQGNCITIDQPRESDGSLKEVDYIVIQVRCDKPVRFCMSISYYNERFASFNPTRDECFSDEVKAGLFGSLDKVDETIGVLNHQKKQKIKEVLNKNIAIVGEYVEYKNKVRNQIKSALVKNTQENRERHFQNRKDDLKRKGIFSKRNERIKKEAEIARQEREKAIVLWKKLYLWKWLYHFYAIMEKINLDFEVRLATYKEAVEQNRKVCQIQKAYKIRFNFYSNKESRNGKLVNNGLNQLARHIKAYTKHKVLDCVQKFFVAAVTPWRLKMTNIQFILIIKSIQTKLRKHMVKKNENIGIVESAWTSELIKLVEREGDYKKMGINYNLDDQQHIGLDIRQKICSHLYNRQLLTYVDERYEEIEKVNDTKQKKKVDLLGKKEGEELESDHMVPEIGDVRIGSAIMKQNLNDPKISQSRRSNQVNLSILPEINESAENKETPLTTETVQQDSNLQELASQDVLKVDDDINKPQQSSRLIEMMERSARRISRRDLRDSRRSIILSQQNNIPEATLPQMLFDEDCGNYDFSNVNLWKCFEGTRAAELYHIAQIKKDQILELEREFDKKQQLRVEKSYHSPVKKRKKRKKQDSSLSKKNELVESTNSVEQKSTFLQHLSQDIEVVEEDMSKNQKWQETIEKLKLFNFKETKKFELSIDKDLLRAFVLVTIDYSSELKYLQF